MSEIYKCPICGQPVEVLRFMHGCVDAECAEHGLVVIQVGRLEGQGSLFGRAAAQSLITMWIIALVLIGLAYVLAECPVQMGSLITCGRVWK